MPIRIHSHRKLIQKWLRYPRCDIAEFDTQHQELLERMNAINEMIAKGGNGETVLHLLSRLTVHFAQHHQNEEQRMLAAHYGRFSSHTEDHHQMQTDLLPALTEAIRRHDPGIDLARLIRWQASHIAHFDKPMAQFLLSRR
ncbi:MAG: hemerythrin domain-containing protein [Magnetococcales bacterium]|nr:hemerythrin domain-containing protein [Magnetococcales bacterium]